MELLRQTFSVKGRPVLDLTQIPGTVRIKRGSPGSVEVVITGDQKYQNEVSVTQSLDQVSVRGPRNYSNTSVSYGNGSNVVVSSTGSSISIVNGQVFINGKEVSQDSSSKNEKPLIFEIFAPPRCDLILGQVSELESDIDVGDVQLAVTGQSDITLQTVASIQGSISGQSEFEAEMNGGTVQCNVSGQSELDISGSFESLNLVISGQADVKTRGQVNGDYTVVASGQSDVKHRGGVHGSVNKTKSGMADISIR